MRILSLSLTNIKSHRSRELSFVPGINVLSGVNGAGKSTIFEAVGYALFGVDARDFVGNIDRFLTIGARKGEVRVTFETDNGETFQVSRTVGAGSKWLLARQLGDRFEVEDHVNAQETEARLKKLLGLDSGRPLADQFKLVIGPFQNEFLGPFVLKQPKKRQEAFDEILGIDAWRKTFKNTATLQNTVKSKIEVLAAEIKGKEEQTALLPDKEKELAGCVAEAQQLQHVLAQQEQLLAGTLQQLSAFDGQEKKLTAVRAEVQVLENRIMDGKSKITGQREQVAESERAVQTVEKNLRGKELFEAAEKTLTTLRGHDKERRAIEKEITALDKEHSRLAHKLEHESGEVAKTEARLHEEEKELQAARKNLVAEQGPKELAGRLPHLRTQADRMRSALGLIDGKRAGLLEGRDKLAEGVCPFFREECRNIAGSAPRDVFTAKVDELDQERAGLDRQLKQLGEEIKGAEQARKEIDAVAIKEQELQKQLTAIARQREQNTQRLKGLVLTREELAVALKKCAARKEELKKFSSLDAELEKSERQRSENQPARDLFFAHQKTAQELKNRQEGLERMQRLLEELQVNLAARQQERDGLEKSYDPKGHAELRSHKDQLVASIATIREKIGGIDKDRQRIEDEIRKIRALREELSAKLAQQKDLEAKERLVRFLRSKIFNHVSSQLSERFREEISLRADSIYRTIAETDESLSWGENYQIILRDMQNGEIRERIDDQLSGGQVMSAVVALRLALLQTIGARIAFFDEPTSNLDATRRENLARAFRAIDIGREEVSEHWYDQLFLVSHDVAFTEITDQIIELEESP